MMDAGPRIEKLRRRLESEQVEAIVVTGAGNMRYLTGFEGVIDSGINAACVVTSDSASFYTDSRYSEASETAAEGTPWEVRVQRESLYVEICGELRSQGIGKLALESSVPYGRFRFISEQFVGNVVPASQWVEDIRQVKEPQEIERIAEAAGLADRAFEHILAFLRPGAVERDVALELEFFLRREGSEGVAFDPIVASGPMSARPHAIPGHRPIASGDLVVLDLGARVGGYCSDLTRTVVVGEATERQRSIYDAVLAANQAGLAAVRPCVPAREIDAAARTVLADLGFGESFGHGLGHGVGIDVHEAPSIGPSADDSVRNGSVVTIEPGVYVPGFGGVRIEDLVVVEESGGRLLDRAPKQLIEL